MRVPLGDVEWHGISWQLRICRLLCHSVVPSVRSACHSVASSGTAMRQGVYSAAQGPSKRQVTPNGSVAAMAPSLPAKRNTLTRLRELVWVGGCVTARAAWASPPGRRRRSVHKLAKMVSRRRFRAFVYTVAPWAWVVSGLGIAIVYTNGRIGPLGAVLGHLCTLLRLARIVRATVVTQECTQIGGNGLSELFWGICVHCCDASRDASCVRWHERLNHHGVPVAPPRWPLPLGREDRLCASVAAARLASSPRRQPTRTPEEPP